jgi:predicted  nucleic acid-binding Zn-ribbon protein
MPLIALDILENKIKELLVIISHLQDENNTLKAKMSDDNRAVSSSPVNVNPELMYELENLKKTVIRYKNDRNQLYSKLAGVLRQVDELVNKG